MVKKKFKLISKELSFLVNTALASAKIKTLKIEEKEKVFDMRPSLHIQIHAPIGQLKSSIMGEIAAKMKKEILTEVTRPGLVGTIDMKSMQFIPGAAWECRNSLMLLDEFSFSRKKHGWEVFLQLLESQSWGKRVGLFSADQHEKDEDLYLKVHHGQINLKTRFACIVATMKRLEIQRGQFFHAFLTRCVPYHFDLDEDDLAAIAQGASLYREQQFRPPAGVTIDNKSYSKLVKLAKVGLSKCQLPHIRKTLYLRSIGDLCRTYAVHGRNDKSYMRNLIRWKVEAQEMVGKAYRKDKRR